MRVKTGNRKKIIVATLLFLLALMGLVGRLVFFMIFQSEYYSKKAQDLQMVAEEPAPYGTKKEE